MQITATHHVHPHCLCHVLTSVSWMSVWLLPSLQTPLSAWMIYQQHFTRNLLTTWLSLLPACINQQSLHQAGVPDVWKQAKVIAIYKSKDDKNDASSYRPISLTAVACKVLERMIGDQLQTLLTDNSLLC